MYGTVRHRGRSQRDFTTHIMDKDEHRILTTFGTFRKDPETNKWLWISCKDIELILPRDKVMNFRNSVNPRAKCYYNHKNEPRKSGCKQCPYTEDECTNPKQNKKPYLIRKSL